MGSPGQLCGPFTAGESNAIDQVFSGLSPVLLGFSSGISFRRRSTAAPVEDAPVPVGGQDAAQAPSTPE
ncbi:predicted protein [Streptomyces viridosporus ATCC 14672]|uniref:Predicted protein n=1 Tax=Streptomyces viridosporus (strain ATCC 14672 / DSM 40746 / JCM 4963 / KCTC 9882 / NRRL B-12104 / FH 1290) TaxID=566461 RepID=D5ZRY6_STRV1|nr:predicted protein [Streptomyces viridosporus ATCC 14672]